MIAGQRILRKWHVCLLFAAVLGSSCGPERKVSPKPNPSAPVTGGGKSPQQPPDLSPREASNSRELMPVLADSLGLRSFDLEDQEPEGQEVEAQGTSSIARICDDSNQSDLGITTLLQEWSAGFARE